MRKLQRLRSKRIKRDRGQFWKKSARVNPNGPNLCIIPLTCFFLWGGNSGWQVLWSGSKNVEPNKISYWLGVNKINAPTSILRRTWVFTHHLSAPQRSSFRNSLGSSATVKPLAAKAAWPLPSQGEPARGTPLFRPSGLLTSIKMVASLGRSWYEALAWSRFSDGCVSRGKMTFTKFRMRPHHSGCISWRSPEGPPRGCDPLPRPCFFCGEAALCRSWRS